MIKKILISANQQEKLIKRIIERLSATEKYELKIHDPLKDTINLQSYYEFIKDFDLIISKISGESPIDLLYAAKVNNIPSINKYESVVLCKNKIALDMKLRTILSTHSNDLKDFFLPKSWLHPSPLNGLKKFKNWASNKLPLVFKSHDQHNKYFRFNFLALNRQEIDKFIIKYKNYLYFDLYIQEFIECDGFDRKIYMCGDKIYGIKRENPIYIYLREKPEEIDVETIERETFELTSEIKKLAQILSKELDLDIFGFDLLKPIDKEGYYLIDLNDFPGFQDIENADETISNFIENYLNSL
jgi:glutathione synthase/RimK-type ligase-like ATP-grasp enzyme